MGPRRRTVAARYFCPNPEDAACTKIVCIIRGLMTISLQITHGSNPNGFLLLQIPPQPTLPPLQTTIQTPE